MRYGSVGNPHSTGAARNEARHTSVLNDKLVFVGLAMRACLSLWERCPQGGEGPLSQLR